MSTRRLLLPLGCDMTGFVCEAVPDSVPAACAELGPRAIEVSTLCDHRGDPACPTLNFPWEAECVYADGLPPGQYCAIVTERRENLDSVGNPTYYTYVESLAFTVQVSTPVEPISWSAVKSTYR